MTFMIDKDGRFEMQHVTSTAASGILGAGDASVFSVQVNPTITGSPSYSAAILQGSNDGDTWFTAATTGASGTLANGVPQFFQVVDGTAGEYRLKIHTTGGGVDAVVHPVTKRNIS